MFLTSTTPLALILVLLILVLGPLRGMVVLFGVLPLGGAAAVNIGGVGSVTLGDAAVLALCVSVLWHGPGLRALMGTLRPGTAGGMLALVVILALPGAALLPRLFEGQVEVFTVLRADGALRVASRPLAPGEGNLAQAVRLVMGALVFVLCATALRLQPDTRTVWRALVVASLVHLACALAHLATPWLGSDPLAWARTALVVVQDAQRVAGLRRLTGAFPEPSSFAYFTAGLYGVWLGAALRGGRAALVMALIMAGLMLLSTSSAGYVTLAVVTLGAVAWHLRSGAVLGGALIVLPLLGALGLLAFALVPTVPLLIEALFVGKLEARSGVERWAWNRGALEALWATRGLGAGLGSLRASGWLFACLGTLGIVGTLAYLGLIGRVLLLRAGAGAQGALVAALQTGCAAILVQALMTRPHPTLGLAFFAMAGAAVGLSRAAVLHGRAVPRAA